MRTRTPTDKATGMHPEERLRELGLTLPDPPQTGCRLRPSRADWEPCFHLRPRPVRDGTRSGKVGAEVTSSKLRKRPGSTCLNGLAVIKAEIGDLANVRRIVKLTVFVASAPGFTDQPLVANGASELLEQVFGERRQACTFGGGHRGAPFRHPGGDRVRRRGAVTVEAPVRNERLPSQARRHRVISDESLLGL